MLRSLAGLAISASASGRVLAELDSVEQAALAVLGQEWVTIGKTIYTCVDAMSDVNIDEEGAKAFVTTLLKCTKQQGVPTKGECYPLISGEAAKCPSAAMMETVWNGGSIAETATWKKLLTNYATCAKDLVDNGKVAENDARNSESAAKACFSTPIRKSEGCDAFKKEVEKYAKETAVCKTNLDPILAEWNNVKTVQWKIQLTLASKSDAEKAVAVIKLAAASRMNVSPANIKVTLQNSRRMDEEDRRLATAYTYDVSVETSADELAAMQQKAAAITTDQMLTTLNNEFKAAGMAEVSKEDLSLLSAPGNPNSAALHLTIFSFALLLFAF